MATLEQIQAELARRQGAQAPVSDPVAQARPVSAADRARMELMRRRGGNLYSDASLFPQSGQRQAPVNPMQPVEGDPTMMTRIVDNVVGLDNGTMSAGEQIAAALNKGGESMTLGIVGDEAAGRFDEAIGRRADGTGVDFYRQQESDLQEANPALSLTADIAPALLPGAGAVGFVKNAGSNAARYGRAALAGSTAAGTYGAMEGEGTLSERLMDGAWAAPAGAIFGVAGMKAGDVLSKLPSGLQRVFSRSEERPSIETLRSAKNAAYRAVDQAGEVFSPDDMAGLSDRVQRIMKEDVSYVPGEDRAVDATLRLLEARSGQETTLSQLDRIRQGLWRRVRANPDQVQIYDAIREVDNLIASRADASDLMAAARLANSRFAKTQLLDDAFTKAADQTASTGSGGNILNKYRQAITSIINNPNKARFFTEGEIEVMRGFVRGDMPENLLRRIGKLSPNGNGLMMALHTYGAVASSGATVPLMAAGAGAKAMADGRVTRGAERLLDMVSGAVPEQLPAIRPDGTALGVASAGPASDAGQEARNMWNRLQGNRP